MVANEGLEKAEPMCTQDQQLNVPSKEHEGNTSSSQCSRQG